MKKKNSYGLYFLILVPFVLYLIDTNSSIAVKRKKQGAFALGLEQVSTDLLDRVWPGCKFFRIGLITNQTGKNLCGERNVDLLLKKGFCIKKLFTPEHGMRGVIHTDESIANSVDKATNVPIVTLYSQGRPIKINAKMLQDIDVLMFDIQEVGMRHYTYITTLFEAMEVAQRYNKKFIVLDRPSLLGPCMDGPLVEPGFKSGISIASIPLRHGMTVGELALYFNRYIFKKPLELHIVAMQNYKRNCLMRNQLITYLSSGIRNLQSCYGYSFLGLLGEIRPFCIGLKKEKKFQAIMLSDKIMFSMQKWKELQTILNSFGIASSFYRKNGKKTSFSGLQLLIENAYNLESFKLLVRILAFFKASGLKMSFSKAFNIAVGTDKLRAFFDGAITYNTFKKFVNNGLRTFHKKAQNCFLYDPFPVVKCL